MREIELLRRETEICIFLEVCIEIELGGMLKGIECHQAGICRGSKPWNEMGE
jgi:hypothetical protein